MMLLLLCLEAVSATRAAPFSTEPTMAQIASAPFPSLLQTAPRTNLIAWVSNDRGARNVWVAQASQNFQPRRLTQYSGDEGIDLVDLTWSGDGKSLYYTRGGDAGGQFAVNPTSDTAGPKSGEIWRVSAEGGSPIRISNGTVAAVAPNNGLVVFIKDGQPFSATSNGKDVAPLFRDRGRVTLVR
jgi:Tol biopolymer transport system component